MTFILPTRDRQLWGVDLTVMEAMQQYGLHPICERCENGCKTYNAPRTELICFDFEKKED